MTAFWAVFVGRLFDPVGALIALTIGAFVRSRWGIVIASLVAVVITSAILFRMDRIETITTGQIIAAFVAFAIWAAIGNLVFRRLMGRSGR